MKEKDERKKTNDSSKEQGKRKRENPSLINEKHHQAFLKRGKKWLKDEDRKEEARERESTGEEKL